MTMAMGGSDVLSRCRPVAQVRACVRSGGGTGDNQGRTLRVALDSGRRLRLDGVDRAVPSR